MVSERFAWLGVGRQRARGRGRRKEVGRVTTPSTQSEPSGPDQAHIALKPVRSGWSEGSLLFGWRVWAEAERGAKRGGRDVLLKASITGIADKTREEEVAGWGGSWVTSGGSFGRR